MFASTPGISIGQSQFVGERAAGIGALDLIIYFILLFSGVSEFVSASQECRDDGLMKRAHGFCPFSLGRHDHYRLIAIVIYKDRPKPTMLLLVPLLP